MGKLQLTNKKESGVYTSISVNEGYKVIFIKFSRKENKGILIPIKKLKIFGDLDFPVKKSPRGFLSQRTV